MNNLNRAVKEIEKIQNIFPKSKYSINSITNNLNRLFVIVNSQLIKNYKNTQALLGNISNFDSSLKKR